MGQRTYLSISQIPILQGRGHHELKEAEEAPGQEDAYRWEERIWRTFLSDEKVVNILDKDFGRTLLPGGFSKRPLLVEEIIKHLEKDEGMTNPRPDMTFGLKREEDSFTTSIPQHILDLL